MQHIQTGNFNVISYNFRKKTLQYSQNRGNIKKQKKYFKIPCAPSETPGNLPGQFSLSRHIFCTGYNSEGARGILNKFFVDHFVRMLPQK